MGEITSQIAIVLGVLVACFAAPAAALFVLIRRKAKARKVDAPPSASHCCVAQATRCASSSTKPTMI
jgi:hypothetical protein